MAVAEFHDQKSISVIQNFDFERIFDLEIDSPSSIYVLLKYLELINVQNSELVFHTNSGELINKLDEPTTSHNFYYFSKGEKENNSLVNFLFFGDIMFDRHVKEMMNKNGGVDYLIEKIAGTEKRFFQGVDIVMANLEGAVTENGEHYEPRVAIDFAFDKNDVEKLSDYNFNFFTLANNHITDQGSKGFYETQANLDDLGFNYVGCADKKVDECSVKIFEVNKNKIAMLAYSMVYGSLDEDKILEQIKDVRESVDLIIVNMHWGVEYEHQARSNQVALAHNMIDAGADIIIGHHPHVVQNVELYCIKRATTNGVYPNDKICKPIFYSLGNFIFDQYFSKETQEGLAVGLTCEEDKIQIDLFPHFSERNQVQLMANTKKERFLEWLAEISDVEEEYKEQIKSGKIKL